MDILTIPGTEFFMELDVPVDSILLDHLVYNKYWIHVYRTPDKELLTYLIDLENRTYQKIDITEH